MLSKEVSSTIFKVFGMKPRSPGSLANTLPTEPMSRFIISKRTEFLRFSEFFTFDLNVKKINEVFLVWFGLVWFGFIAYQLL